MILRPWCLLTVTSLLLLPGRLLAQNPAAVRSHTFTIHSPNIGLLQALHELTAQTGITVADRRQHRQGEPHFSLNLPQASFWEGLDAIARAANVNVSLYQPGAAVAIVDGPHRAVPTSYSGLFRVQLHHIEVSRDFQAGTGLCRLSVEITWEPGFRPLFLQTGSKPPTVRPEQGTPLQVIGAGAGRESLSGQRVFAELPLVLSAPPRVATKLALLQGEVSLIGPSRTVLFGFDDLQAAGPGSSRARPQQTKDGITVTLRRFEIEQGTPTHWNVGFALQYPAVGPAFDSFESWLVSSRVRLVRKGSKGKPSLAPTGYSDDTLPGHRATFDYTFTPGRGVRLEQPREWKLIYEVPGPMVELPVRFTFRDVPLP